jgi:hypothetical protein
MKNVLKRSGLRWSDYSGRSPLWQPASWLFASNTVLRRKVPTRPAFRKFDRVLEPVRLACLDQMIYKHR